MANGERLTLAKLESGFDDVGFDAFKPERIRKREL